MRPTLAAIVAIALLAGCQGQIGSNADAARPDGAGPPGDGGVVMGEDGGVYCEGVSPVAMIFANSCALRGGCHTTGGQYPDLTFAHLAEVIGAPSRVATGETLVVAGDPSRSFLYRKMTGMQGPGGGLLMPIGTSQPIEGVAAVEAWIRAGAPTRCEGLEIPAPPRDPNTLDQGALFTCAMPGPASSPARIRRVERTEWTHASGNTLRSLAYDNPFYAPAGRYSSWASGVTLDSASLDLFMLTLPQAGRVWSDRDSGGAGRLYAIYSDPTLGCMFNDAAPSAACIDRWVDRVLTAGTLFRAPDDGERARLRAMLVGALGAEGGVANRRTTLTHVASAAWLTSGALFRAELGLPVMGDAAGRRRLSNDELALALGSVISTHPPGSPLPQTLTNAPEPDRSDPMNGWLGQVRRAAVDGSIQQPAVLRTLLRTYRGGVDANRADIRNDSDARDLPARGEYWLAPRIAGFFREWLDYAGANSAFKDAPAATSAWHGQRGAELGYSNLQHSYYGYESTLVAQLDDTIARAVLESESRNEDVFRALLTTRMWRLPSNLAAAGTSIANSTDNMHRVYGMTTDVPATPEGRWVQMPEGARAGVLTHPAWLTAHGGNFEDDASAVLRGHWIREHLYCQTVPGLDLVMVEAQLVPSAPNLRARDRVRVSIEEGGQAATCMGCHRLMNSLGMPFEVYNHAGFARAMDHGMAPDGRSRIDLAPDPSLAGEVRDAVELSQMLAGSPYARRCFVRHVFRYFTGRDETLADACTLRAMESAFAGGSFFAMLEALVTSDTFLYRHVAEGGTP